ncbi:hypothetical protein B0T22DRAFT_472054 [Podospora appendiculata]|uniref:Ankyrin repeat protein n=1 Tax=Podospora appendiculata TaxID=314037 RepID=A0AAE0X1N5_9PEZI|nr:hypothetical protein B0T22DRAFT_472054 [Podospora appendiculata]
MSLKNISDRLSSIFGFGPDIRAPAPDEDFWRSVYKVGDSTIETIFTAQLSIVCTPDGTIKVPSDGKGEAGHPDNDHCDDSDLFLTALDFACGHLSSEKHGLMAADKFIPVLTRCITESLDSIQHADGYMKKQCGISALENPVLLQILVALAVKHRNMDLLRQLLGDSNSAAAAKLNMLSETETESLFATLDDAIYGAEVWACLAAAEWVKPMARTEVVDSPPVCPDLDEGVKIVEDALALQQTNPSAALAMINTLLASGWEPQCYTGLVLERLVESGTATMLLRYLPRVSRTLYDGIPPHSVWPGDACLVARAAARADEAEGLRVLRVLVGTGGMDVSTDCWYKAGVDDNHPHCYDPRLPDQSCANESPLHAAVQRGSAEVVGYLLGKGARRAKDAYGRDQAERAVLLGKEPVVEVFARFGWLSSTGGCLDGTTM